MNILLINHYAGSPLHGMEYRPYYLAREWVKAGHRVRIVAASQSHLRTHAPQLATRAVLDEDIDGIAYRWLATPSYDGNGIRRAANIAAFLARLTAQSAQLAAERPDLVIASSTYPADIWPARRIARLAGARLVFEVHDLWPLSPIELGGMSPRHPFIRLMQAAENAACRHADTVISILPHAASHLIAHGMAPHKLHVVPNGVALAEWERAPAPLPAPVTTLLDSLRAEGRMVVGYAGSQGRANALDTLLDAATLLQHRQRDLHEEALPGTPAIALAATLSAAAQQGRARLPDRPGADLAEPTPDRPGARLPDHVTYRLGAALPEHVTDRLGATLPHHLTDKPGAGLPGHVPNSPGAGLPRPLPKRPGERLPAQSGHGPRFAFVLAGDGPEKQALQRRVDVEGLRDVHFIAPLPKACIPALLGGFDIAYLGWRRQPLYRYGISPNKLGDYLMAARPVIHAVDAANDPVADAGCGLSIAPEDPAALADAIDRLARLTPWQRHELGQRGASYARRHLDYRLLARRFLEACGGTGPPDR
ncbi:glycosyltransferase family 4 protein [Duganella sp. Leaf126]|uniref:glycosyltransferase family 4 protein n=1 Tax=Duganella sp. Leaf126 TaxID=1736266 RepID=UPI000A40D842|nr:glycosyltransferase family 4 protein [Duganella sp. Leaf126]